MPRTRSERGRKGDGGREAFVRLFGQGPLQHGADGRRAADEDRAGQPAVADHELAVRPARRVGHHDHLGARRRSLDRHHDAWLSAARAQGPLSDHEALIDLGVLRWRGALPSWASIGERWGWRPRSEVGPLLERFPTSAPPDFAHVEVEVAHG